MTEKGPDFGERFNLSRRDLLLLGAIGIVGILGYNFASQAINSQSSPETTIERSSDFSAEPTWIQDFLSEERTTLDTAVWRYDLDPAVPGYNDELQGYTDWAENVRIEPGVGLVIEAHEREYTYPNDPEATQYAYTSGRIDTLNSFSFEYGKVEASIKLPEGGGVWPAFWLLSGNEVHTIDGNFSPSEIEEDRFYTRNGEIDIMEYYGLDEIEGTVHTYNQTSEQSVPLADVDETFHTYGIELTPDTLIWTLDGEPYHTFQKPSDNPEDWPFQDNNHLYVILNLALGGPAGQPTSPDGEPWRLEVQHVKYYEYTGEPE